MAVWARVVFLMASLSLAAGTWQNVALNKPAWMSRMITTENLPASNAVDGVTTANGHKNSVHTESHERSAWWKVDLQGEVQSAQVKLYFRTDYKLRRNGVQLYTSETNSVDPKEGHLCDTVAGRPDGTDIPDVLNVTCPGSWRYLTVYTGTDNDGDGAVLDFVEVQVWTCASGHYGTNCGPRCAVRHCKMDPSCDVIQGQCVGGCAAGYQGTDCTQECTSLRYGPNCARDCSSRHCKLPSSTCDRVSGTCPGGCEDGWTEIDCSRKCPSAKYGFNCNSACGHCADNNICHHVTGACPGGCQAGWQLPLCQTESSQKDSAITPTTAGIIGLAAGVCIMLILGVGLYVGLVRQGSLQWISTSQKDVVKVGDTKDTVPGNTTEPPDNYTSLSEQAVGRNTYNNDYDVLDVEAASKSDVIMSKAYEDL